MFEHLPHLGVGIGYRWEIDNQIKLYRDRIDWLELITEHFLSTTPDREEYVTLLGKQFPLIPHGIDLSIGTVGPLDQTYVNELGVLLERIRPPWFSDHLCFTKAGGVDLGHLTPVRRTEALAAEIAAKARKLGELTRLPFLLENITYYFEVGGDLTDTAFITTILDQSGCGLLLDVTNVFVNSVNHAFDPYRYLDSLPLDRVVQIHLGGCRWQSGVLQGACPCKRARLRGGECAVPDALMIDTHADEIPEPVWELLAHVVRSAPVKAVLIERDSNFSNFGDLLRELDNARAILNGGRPQLTA